jgi:O-antigen/teichoic acid export membrane protein
LSGSSAGTGARSGYGAGAKLLSVGIASTGLVTFAYFSVASYALDEVQTKRVNLLWAILFIVVSVLYRPVEQLLSRTIAQRRARGLHSGHPLGRPLLIQATFALAFLVAALLAREPLEELLGGAALYGVFVAAVLFYSASYFARGYLAGHQQFALYGGLVFLEANARLLFALAVLVGLASGQTAVALGMAAAPLLSLVVVPLAFRRREVAGETAPPEPEAVARGAGGFALAVFLVQLSEQTLLNAGVLLTELTSSDAAVAGFVFSALLITRAPLQLFQAIQGSLLPHLAGLEATAGREEFSRAIRITVLAIVAFAGAVALGLLLLGPFAMDLLFEDSKTFGRWGLALVAVGMGAHLVAGTLNQAALARGRAGLAAAGWLLAATAFVGWMLVEVVEDPLLRAEAGYAGASALLCLLLTAVYRSGSR